MAGTNNVIHLHISDSPSPPGIFLVMLEIRCLTGGSRANLAHVLRRKRHRATSTDTRVTVGMAGERIDLDGIAREPSAAVTIVS